MLISYTISKDTLTFDIEGHVIRIGFDIGYDIAPNQYHSLWSRNPLCPGSIPLDIKDHAVFDIEGLIIVRYRRSPTFDIERQ